MITYRLLRFSNDGAVAPPGNPSWVSYNFGSSPSSNGFTQDTDLGSPTLNLVVSGNPNQRRVEITPNGGQILYRTVASPGLDPLIGATGECVVSVSGSDERAGFEIGYLNGAVNWTATDVDVELHLPGGASPSQTVEATGLDNTGDTTFRLTIDAARAVRLYRDGALLLGPLTMPLIAKPSDSFMWWGEP